VGENEIREHLREALLTAGQTKAVEACEADVDTLLFSQSIFDNSMQGILTLGTLVKYATSLGKRIVIVPHDIKTTDEDSEDV
jgi:hypothetical protein